MCDKKEAMILNQLDVSVATVNHCASVCKPFTGVHESHYKVVMARLFSLLGVVAKLFTSS